MVQMDLLVRAADFVEQVFFICPSIVVHGICFAV